MIRPWMPLYVADYLADTMDLETDQHGAYLIMLMIAWRRPDGAIPNDLAWLRRALSAHVADMHGNRFNRLVPPLLQKFFSLESDGNWHQKRLTKEREKAEKFSEKQREKVKKRFSHDNKNNVLEETAALPARARQSQSQSQEISSLRSDISHESHHTREKLIPRKRVSTKTSLFLENPDFQKFWEQFPKKTGIGTARKVYDRIVMEGIATPQDLLAGAMRYSEQRSGEDERYTKSPENWLNGECWLDEAPPQRPRTETKSGYVSPVDAIMAGAKSYFKTGEPE